MRSFDDYRRILELWEQGFNKKEIERLTSIPRGTVLDCIKRYGSLKGLEENKERASKVALMQFLAGYMTHKIFKFKRLMLMFWASIWETDTLFGISVSII